MTKNVTFEVIVNVKVSLDIDESGAVIFVSFPDERQSVIIPLADLPIDIWGEGDEGFYRAKRLARESVGELLARIEAKE